MRLGIPKIGGPQGSGKKPSQYGLVLVCGGQKENLEPAISHVSELVMD